MLTNDCDDMLMIEVGFSLLFGAAINGSTVALLGLMSTASPVQHTERDQRSASVPMPPLLMRLINNLWS